MKKNPVISSLLLLFLLLSVTVLIFSCRNGEKPSETVAESSPLPETDGHETSETDPSPETFPESSPETEHRHLYAETVVAPTCTENGYSLYVCECGDSFRAKTVAAYGHIWDDGEIVREPTEDESGLARYHCLLCGSTKETVLPNLAHTHEFHISVVEPTCLTEGYTLHLCDCGNSYRDNITPPLEHDWDEGIITRQPTEAETGLKIRTCKNCGDRNIEILEKLPHRHHYVSTVIPPTCTENGYTLNTCEICGSSYKDAGIPALGHQWGEGVVTRPPTEYVTGVRLHTCARCGEFFPETIEKLPHTHLYLDQIIHPTCIAEGFTVHTCLCGDSYIDRYTPPLGHVFGEWLTVTQPTETAPGLAERSCSVCGRKETKVLPSLSGPDELRDRLFILINEAREAEELPLLAYNADFQQIVSARSLELTARFSHTRPDGRSCFSIFEDIGFYAFTHAGETIAFGYETPEEVFDAWMASETHRAQILGEFFTSVTVGHIEADGVSYVIAVFVG